MAGEFTKSTVIRPAVVGAIANPDEYNQNIAGQSKDSILGIDADGNFADFNVGDESKGTNGSLALDIKLRSGGNLKVYNSSGVLIETINLTGLKGSIVTWPTNSPPSGYLECDGSAISRTTYSDLFSIIGTTWGSGDGSTTFNIPDLRGEFIRGWDNGAGVDSGRSFASAQSWAIENITGSQNGLAWRSGYVGTGGTGAFQAYGSGGVGANTLDQANGAYIDFDASRVVQTSTETRPRNISLMYCIKY